MGKWSKILNKKNYDENTVFGEEYRMGGIHDSKPSLAILDKNELVMFTNHHVNEEFEHEEPRPDMAPLRIHTVMYRSHDGGISWDNGEHAPFIGYEASVTVIDGIVFVQTHQHLRAKIYQDKETCIGHIYRSDDMCKTWTETIIDSEFLGEDYSQKSLCTTRNFIKLKDSSIIIMVTAEGGQNYRLRSTDKGLSWSVEKCYDTIEHHPEASMFCEAVMFYTPSGRLMCLGRIEWALIYDKSISHIYSQDERFSSDNGDGLLLMESFDYGLTWNAVRGVGYMGMMYPSVVYLDDKRFILTYTMRIAGQKPYPKMGVQAVFGRENEDGSFCFDFENDIVIIDDSNPDYHFSGSGYGMTNRLSDGTFITPYSYREYTKEYDEMMKNKKYLESDDLFLDKSYRAGQNKHNQGANIDWWHRSDDEWKKIIINEFAERLSETWCPTKVLRWNIQDN